MAFGRVAKLLAPFLGFIVVIYPFRSFIDAVPAPGLLTKIKPNLWVGVYPTG